MYTTIFNNYLITANKYTGDEYESSVTDCLRNRDIIKEALLA